MIDPQSALRTTEQLNAALAGRYLVEREIGRGGMATVYLAADAKHNRKVALKVLKPDLGAALGPERFLAEIEVTAGLQHPNLLPLFDSGEIQPALDGGQSLLFYVMPYVEGQTLRARLQREGQLPVEEALRIATAIAGALDYAHRHGVVHRDLKPENILVHEGQPVVMDFGIALAVQNAGGERLTQMGISLGTPQYMSPEQATGDRELDARSDVYSLAAVLYEMLTGHPPHTGTSIQAVIAKVIVDRPATVRATRELVPEHVDAAIMRALAKLPADRFATAAEFAQALGGSHAMVVRETHAPAAWTATLRTSVGAVLERPVARRVVVGSAWTMVLGAAAAIGAVVALALIPTPEAPYAKLPVAFPDSVALPGIGRAIAISRDGSHLALSASASGRPAQIYTRRMTGVDFTPLHGTESASAPSFSPDGASLLFVTGGRLMKVSSEGGAVLPLADSTDGQHSWGDNEQIAFIRRGALWIVPAGGGAARLVAQPDSSRGERAFRWPDVLPGGEQALITIERTSGLAPDSNHIGVVSLNNGKVSDFGVVGTGARFAAPGHVLYGTARGALWAAPLSGNRRRVTGEPILLADGMHVDSTGAADVSASESGTILYGESSAASPGGGFQHVAIAVVDREGKVKVASTQKGNYLNPRASPDGARVALVVREGAQQNDVWIFEIATGQLTPMTRDRMSSQPEWLDARRIVFRENSGNPGRFMVQPWDHSAVAQVFLTPSSGSGTAGAFNLALGPANGFLALIRNRGFPNAQRHQDIWIAPMTRTSDQRELVATDFSDVSPRISPNGRWVAYSSNESQRFQLYVVPVPGPGARVPISVDHGIAPVWSRDGKTLYYVSNGHLLAAHVDESSGFRTPKTDTLFSFTEREFVNIAPRPRLGTPTFYDVMPSGDFVVLARGGGADATRSSVVAMLHWRQLLKSEAASAKK